MRGKACWEPYQKLADAQLHRHHHGVQAQHVILRLQGNAIGRVLHQPILSLSARHIHASRIPGKLIYTLRLDFEAALLVANSHLKL